MFTRNECCYKQTSGLCGLEALNHGSKLKYYGIRFDRRSQNFGFHMIAGSQTIADNRRRSQKIEHGSIFCDRLRSRSQNRRRSQTIAEVCFHMIADDRRTFCDLRSAICDLRSAICDLRSAIVCDHMEPAFRHGIRLKKNEIRRFSCGRQLTVRHMYYQVLLRLLTCRQA